MKLPSMLAQFRHDLFAQWLKIPRNFQMLIQPC
jgi:hypothetical protein